MFYERELNEFLIAHSKIPSSRFEQKKQAKDWKARIPGLYYHNDSPGWRFALPFQRVTYFPGIFFLTMSERLICLIYDQLLHFR
jgi:hypothetical protein